MVRPRTEVKRFGVLGSHLAAALVRAVEHVPRNGRLRCPFAGSLALDAALEGELLHLAPVGSDDVLGVSLESGGRGLGGLRHAGDAR